jgi:hypothetical protein
MKKTEVKVETIIEDGEIVPKVLIWPDGRRFAIQRVIYSSASPVHEYDGIRYSVSFNGKERYIYLVNNRWYVYTNEEAK